MSATIQCPNCRKTYRLRQELIGRKVKCQGCGHAFQILDPAEADLLIPLPDEPSLAAEPRNGLNNLFDEAFDTPIAEEGFAAGAALSAGDPLGSLPTKRRSRKQTAADGLFAKLGIPIALLGVILLVVFPLLGFDGFAATVLGALPILAGGGMAVYAFRQNLPAALAAGVGMLALLVVVLIVRPGSRSPEAVGDDLIVQLDRLPELLEPASDGAAVERARVEALQVFSSILDAQRRLTKSGPPGSPELEQAIEKYNERMRYVATRLPTVTGGAQLAHELAMLAKDVPVPPRDKGPTSAWDGGFEYYMDWLAHACRTYAHENDDDYPPDWDAVEAVYRNARQDLARMQKLRAMGLVVQWNVGQRDLTEISGDREYKYGYVDPCVHDFVLAYLEETLEQPGYVLFMDGVIRHLGPNDLREKLNAQAPKVEAITGVAPPTWPLLDLKKETISRDLAAARRLNLKAWVYPSWEAPPPPGQTGTDLPFKFRGTLPVPPEPAQNVERRRNYSIRHVSSEPFAVFVHVERVSEEDRKLISRILAAAYPEVKVSYTWRNTGNRSARTVVTGVKDLRAFATQLDLGEITEYNEQVGRITIRLDQAKLIEPPPGSATPTSAPPSIVEQPPQQGFPDASPFGLPSGPGFGPEFGPGQMPGPPGPPDPGGPGW